MTNINKKNKKALDKQESLQEYEIRLRKTAIESAKNHVDTKPIKYLLK